MELASLSLEELIEIAKKEVLEKKKAVLANDESLYLLAKEMNSSLTMTFDQFKEYALIAPDNLKKYFNADYFITPTDRNQAIECEDFLRFIQRSMDVESTVLELLPYAKEIKKNSTAHAYLNEKELERYIFDLIPDIAGCRNLPESFYPFYVFTSARRFFFYLDSKHHRQLSIYQLAHSTIMEEFLFFKRLSLYEKQQQQSSSSSDSNNITNAAAGGIAAAIATSGSNWFSGENARAVYTSYINLDKDHNGMLNQRELIALNSFGQSSSSSSTTTTPCQLTAAAIHRIFEEYINYTPHEMDYKTYLDLILALENKLTIQSLAYFWRVLDIDKTGRLTIKSIQYFYKDIFNCLKALNYEAPSIENIIIEIYDILACNRHDIGPAFQEFVASGQGHTVITMLLDVHGFWTYDNRESLIAQQQQEEQEKALQLEQQQQQMNSSSISSNNTNITSTTTNLNKTDSVSRRRGYNSDDDDDEDDDITPLKRDGHNISNDDDDENAYDTDDYDTSGEYEEMEKFNQKLQHVQNNNSNNSHDIYVGSERGSDNNASRNKSVHDNNNCSRIMDHVSQSSSPTAWTANSNNNNNHHAKSVLNDITTTATNNTLTTHHQQRREEEDYYDDEIFNDDDD